jgi:hypothetical protein
VLRRCRLPDEKRIETVHLILKIQHQAERAAWIETLVARADALPYGGIELPEPLSLRTCQEMTISIAGNRSLTVAAQ